MPPCAKRWLRTRRPSSTPRRSGARAPACRSSSPPAGVEITPEQLAAFARARARGKKRVDELARAAALEWKLGEAQCLDYLRRECVYELGADEMRRALHAFRDGAAPLGLARAELAPQPISLEPAPARRNA